VAVVFATQSLDDVAASSIAASLVESCPTQVFLPNPRALEPGTAELYRAFGLNARQLELVAFATPKRAYYWRQPQGRRLFDLKLSGVGLALCGSSSPDDQKLIDLVLERAGPDAFLRTFLKAKGAHHVDAVFDSLAEAPLAAE
jgi:type IV secretion system protein TrbE